MKVIFYTLGCKVNTHETSALTRLFCDNGFELSDDEKNADVYIVNSCTVTAAGDKKSRQWLRRAKRQNPHAVTALIGCYPQAFIEKACEIEQADIIIGTNAKGKILDYVLQSLQTGERIIDIQPHEKNNIFEELPNEKRTDKTRAFVKIQDGCNRRCAYCIIPKARGNVRSRNSENIINEIKALASENCKEIVLTGINLSSYGQDTNTNLAQIVDDIAKINGIENIRLGSLEPDLVTDEQISAYSLQKKLCPQFHLALQSGSDKILKSMRRTYTKEQFRNVVSKIREKIPNAVFITDIIVGFPGESEEDFKQTCDFVREIGFLKVHVFSFSKRQGTPAFTMENQIDAQTKAHRSRLLQKISDEVRTQIIKMHKGKQTSVLLEKRVSANTFTGYTRHYIPVLIKATNKESGDIVNAVLGDYDGERCSAHLIV